MDDRLPAKPTARLPVHRWKRIVALAMLALLVAIPAGASAHGAHRSSAATRSCSSSSRSTRRSRRVAKHGCTKRHVRKARPTHKPKSSNAGATAAPLVPAVCEDATPPSHSGGIYNCEDGSAPACEDGVLVHSVAAVAPMCAVKPGSGKESTCSTEGASGCATVEFACNDSSEGEASKSCQQAGEEEAPEPEQEE